MLLVDQRCECGLGRDDPLSGIFHAAGILRHGDDFKIFVFELLIKCLPAWQVKAAPSPGGPGYEKNFLAAKIRERMHLASHVRQRKIRGLQRGEGLALPLDQFDVSLAPGEPAALLYTRGDAQEASWWSLREIRPGAGYVAAVAMQGYGWHLACWQWQE